MEQGISLEQPNDIGQVQLVRLRASRTQPSAAVSGARAVAGLGFEGDIHADPLSPRQLLLAGAAAYAEHALEAAALGENLLLDLDTALLKSGSLLKIGGEVVLWLSFQCEPCGQLNAHQPGLSSRIGMRRGMLARVLHGGVIKPGDRVVRLQSSLASWSDDWRERVAHVLASVPDGMVIDYKQLARLAGVAASYCRVFPRVARNLGAAHKVVATRSWSAQPRWEGWELFGAR